MADSLWTRDEYIVVLDLYLNHPDVVADNTNPEVKRTAELIGRNPGAVSSRLANYRHVDPRGTKGLTNISNQGREIWHEFAGNESALEAEAQQARRRLADSDDDSGRKTETGDESTAAIETSESQSEQPQRQGQSSFRDAVLERYESECVICDIADRGLLQAGHILDWSEFDQRRGDPSNGLLMCYTHHKAFDTGYFTLNSDFELKISPDFTTESNFLKETLIERDGDVIEFAGSPPEPGYLEKRNERLPWDPNNEQ